MVVSKSYINFATSNNNYSPDRHKRSQTERKMKASYKVVKTINGHRSGTVIDEFDNIEDARKQLFNELMYAGSDDYHYFASKEEAEAEISDVDEIRADWGDARVDSYIAALREGVESGSPFIANSISGECITAQYDRFSYDNYTVEIETQEATSEPFESGTYYPLLTQDEQGNNKWVDYCDGNELVGLSLFADFASMDEDFQEQVLDNTKDDDHDAITAGQVWANDERTMFAVFYGE